MQQVRQTALGMPASRGESQLLIPAGARLARQQMVPLALGSVPVA